MAFHEVKYRAKEQPERGDITDSTDKTTISGKRKRAAMAKRGLRSLALALAVPFSLTLADVSVFGSFPAYRSARKPSWSPSPCALHLACPLSSVIMGLSAWLVWADGGFHRKPVGLGLYLTHLILSLAWVPTVFSIGSGPIGLSLSLAAFGALIGCFMIFRGVNPIAASLVKPCLAWAGFLVLVNFNLL